MDSKTAPPPRGGHPNDRAIAAPQPAEQGVAPARDWRQTLAAVTEYRNEQVLFRFCRHFAIERQEAEGILVETMKWLWLCEYNRQANPAPVDLRIDAPLRIIDEMWHNLILHTAEYRRLCRAYFGAYVEHFPATEKDHADYDRQRESLPPEAFLAARRERARPQYELVYDQLGVDTFRTWYVHYPRQYSDEAIKALRR